MTLSCNVNIINHTLYKMSLEDKSSSFGGWENIPKIINVHEKTKEFYLNSSFDQLKKVSGSLIYSVKSGEELIGNYYVLCTNMFNKKYAAAIFIPSSNFILSSNFIPSSKLIEANFKCKVNDYGIWKINECDNTNPQSEALYVEYNLIDILSKKLHNITESFYNDRTLVNNEVNPVNLDHFFDYLIG